MPWVDKQNIFMMGFSRGGVKTAKYAYGGLRGRIIIGWTCHSGWPEYSGIYGSRNEPILAVVASKDPVFTDLSNTGHCQDAIFSKRNLESSVIDVDFHAVHTLTKVREKILQFLEANRRF